MDKIIISLVLEFIPPPQNTFHISQPLPSHPQTKDGGAGEGLANQGRERKEELGVYSQRPEFQSSRVTVAKLFSSHPSGGECESSPKGSHEG